MDAASARRPSRRTVARGAAWSVPVIAVGAAAPAFAASGGTANFDATCGTTNHALYSLSVTGSSASSVNVVFTRTGNGNFTVAPPDSTWVVISSTANVKAYSVQVVNGSVSGTATVTFELGQNGSATVSAEVQPSGGQVITGDTVATATISRNGNSGNYNCTATA